MTDRNRVTTSPVTAPDANGTPMAADFAATVRRYMTARGMSLRELARAAGYSDHTLLSRTLNGHRPAGAYLAAALDQALEAGGDIIAAHQTAQAIAEAARLPLRELADHAAELGAWAETGTAGPSTITTLAEEIDRVVRDHSFSPPGPLILRASDVCQRTSRLMRQHQRLRHSQDLFVIASRCCAFMSAALGDIGQQAPAATYAATALTLAEESGDNTAIALALSVRSKVAFWDGRHDHAASLAARGYDLAGKAGTLRVLLACQAADAAPVPRAREAITLARNALETAGPHIPGVFSCGRARTAAYAATLRLREGNYPGVLAAAAEAGEALAGGELASFGSITQTRISAALACLASGDLSQAAELLQHVTSLPESMRLATFTAKMAAVAHLAATGPYQRSREARDLAGMVRSYLGTEPEPMPYPLAIEPAPVP